MPSADTDLRMVDAEEAFARALPASLLRASRYWTAGAVVERAVRWLEAEGARTVLDVGSGVGKFCTLGALLSNLSFTGIEHRSRLVDVAKAAAAALAVERVRFVHSHFRAASSSDYDALYFFNPFQEHLAFRFEQLDQEVELSEAGFDRDLLAAESMLKATPVGSLLLTYYQFGGRIPLGYSLVRAARYGASMLRLWRKASLSLGHGFWLEDGPRVLRKQAPFAAPHASRRAP